MGAEEISKEVSREVRIMLGGEYDVDGIETLKNNGVKLDGVQIRRKGEAISHVVYINEHAGKGMAVKEIAKMVVEMYSQNAWRETGVKEITSIISDYGTAKKNLSIRLLNKESNIEMLEEVPYEGFLDLALIAVLDFGDSFVKVTEGMAEIWEVGFGEVMQEARRNYFSKPQTVMPLMEMTADMGFDLGAPDEIPGLVPMYVITNEAKNFGAASITSECVMEGVVEKSGGDVLVFPSSVHECIAMPYSDVFGLSELCRMVREVNGEHVNPEEVLSDHVYIYRKGRGWEY